MLCGCTRCRCIALTCTLQVQVQRRETERQAEQRLASFAHISQTEAEEKWKTLNYASPDSEVATGIWERLLKPTQQEACLASMPCPAYLSTLTAGKPGASHGDKSCGVITRTGCSTVRQSLTSTLDISTPCRTWHTGLSCLLPCKGMPTMQAAVTVAQLIALVACVLRK